MSLNIAVHSASLQRAAIALLILFTSAAHLCAGTIVRSATGADAAAIQATVDQFRADLGGGSPNPDAFGSLLTGRREINWDGVPDDFAAPNALPPDFFNVNSPRGVVFTGPVPGTTFQVSADDSNPSGTQAEFGNLNVNYPAVFQPFSGQRLFTPINSSTTQGRITDIRFFVPGTGIPATVSAFGAVFSDVDAVSPGTTIQFFTYNDVVLTTVGVPVADDGLSFMGLSFNSGERITRVRIISGTTTPGPNDVDGASSSSDVVAMDDFIYSEPIGYPDVVAVTLGSNQLLRFNSRSPSTTLTTTPISGLSPGQGILGIDFRPATGQLYALVAGDFVGKLATISLSNPPTITTLPGSFSMPPGSYGFDFDPMTDRARIVNDQDTNYSVDPVTGMAALHWNLNPASSAVIAAAYTNNFAGAQSTTLFGLDTGTDRLVTISPATGAVTTGPALNSANGNFAIDTYATLDIQGYTNTAFATVTVSGAASFLAIDTDDAFARVLASDFPGNGTVIGSMAVVPQTASAFTAPPADIVGIDALGKLIEFRSDAPATVISSVSITGKLVGESIQALDFRPANGRLYALGITDGPDSNDSEGRLYTINRETGVATPVAPNNAPFQSNMADARYGFDFNPATDRVRVVNRADQNLVVNPDTGALVSVDFNLQTPGNEAITAIAYDRNDNDPATASTLFGINYVAGTLVRIGGEDGNPTPATGSVTPIGSLGLDLTVPSVAFDISDRGTAFAAFDTSEAQFRLYAIDLQSGAAYALGNTSNSELNSLTVVPQRRAQLANISTRLRVETDDNVLIGGFIISGDEGKKVIVRALGPSLGTAGALGDPTLEIYAGGQLIASNNNWRENANQQEIIDSTIPPGNDLEAAFLGTLAPGAYTAIVRGIENTTGIGLVEVYDIGPRSSSRLANIATRGFVQTDDDVLIGGLIVVGETGQLRVLIRGIGPSLNLPAQLADPTIELYDANGGSMAFNNNWRDSQEAEINATTIPPSNDLEAALVVQLPPANYTAILRGVDNTTGIGVVEIYALSQ